MNDILILTATAGASALVGIALTRRALAAKVERYRAAYNEAEGDLITERNRMVRALKLIPPYSRNANGALQKVGKALRGETA